MSINRPLHRLPVPLQKQRQDGDCLVACASMVLAYIGRSAYRWRLSRILQPKGYGIPFSHITKLARLGVQVHCQRGTLQDIYEVLTHNHPPIVSVQTAELPYWRGIRNQHSVVLVGMDDKYVFLNDPIFSVPALRVPIGDFDLAWFEQDEQYAILML